MPEIIRADVEPKKRRDIRSLVREGMRFGKLRVLQYSSKRDKWGGWYVLCLCDCGREKIVGCSGLLSGGRKTCGGKECKAVKHGKSSSPIYQVWAQMVSRCAYDHPSYGGRGIKVCDRWLKFENFLADVGEPVTWAEP